MCVYFCDSAQLARTQQPMPEGSSGLVGVPTAVATEEDVLLNNFLQNDNQSHSRRSMVELLAE